MKIILINGSSVPLYEQIKNAIKENILKNKVEEGEQLPSVRTLSKDLKVSILTVKKAYDELEEEGFVESRQGLGTFVQGIMMTRDSLWKVLEKEGLEEIESDGVEFDPNFHHAFQTEENEDFKSNYIIETYQKGYKLNDRVIRPSMVKVAK